MGKATEAALDALHGLLAESMTDELKLAIERAHQPVMIPDADGKQMRNPLYEPLSPKLLAVAIKFLKDNGIDAPAASPRFNSVIDELRKIDVDSDALLPN